MKLIYTIGHSTRPIESFLDLLELNGIERVADIRTIPKSRRYPQYNDAALAEFLAKHDILYAHLANLGGLRHARRDSLNTGWRNKSFRGYADYMSTLEFKKEIEVLMRLAGRTRTAFMCAEAVPWRCHRSLLADALAVAGWRVLHIISTSEPKQHHLTPFLKVQNDRLVYSDDVRQRLILADPD